MEKPLDALGLELSAILYTERFNDTQKDYLEYINTHHYGNKLKIQRIYPDHSKYFFRVRDHNPKISEWLRGSFYD